MSDKEFTYYTPINTRPGLRSLFKYLLPNADDYIYVIRKPRDGITTEVIFIVDGKLQKYKFVHPLEFTKHDYSSVEGKIIEIGGTRACHYYAEALTVIDQMYEYVGEESIQQAVNYAANHPDEPLKTYAQIAKEVERQRKIEKLLR